MKNEPAPIDFSVYEISPVPIAILNAPHADKFIYVNKHWGKLFGISKTTIHRKVPHDFFPAGQWKKLQNHLKSRASGSNHSHHLDLMITNNAGKTKAIELFYTFCEFNSSRVIHATAIAKQETPASKKGTRRIKMNDLGGYIDEASQAISVYDTNGILVQANKTWEKIWQKSTRQAIGHLDAWHDALNTELGFVPHIKEALKGHANRIEKTHIRRARKDQWLRSRFDPIKGKDGSITGIIIQHEDITPETQSGELEPALDEFRLLYESMHDAYVKVDMNGKIMHYNSAYRELLGYNDDELSKLSYTDITPKKWHNFDVNVIKKQILSRGYSDVYQKEYRCKDGGIIPVEMRSFLFQDKNGQPSGIWAIVRDIRDRQAAESRLSESESQHRAIFEQTAVGVAMVSSRTGEFIRINQKYCDILGYSMHELKQKNFQELTHPEDLENSINQVQALINGDIRNFSIEKRYIRKNGTPTWVNLTVSPLWAPNETPNYHVAVIEDITARKKAEMTLQQIQARFNESQRVSHTGSWDWDMINNTTWMTDETYKILGIKANAPFILPDSFFNMIGENEQEHARTAFYKAIDEKKLFNIDVNLKRPNGSERTFNIQGRAFYNKDAIAFRMTGTIQDITKRKKNLIELKNKQQRLNLALRAANQGIWDTDLVTHKAKVNTEYTRMLGYQYKHFHETYESWVDRIHPEDRDKTIQKFTDYLKGKSAKFQCEFRLKTHSGTWKWIYSVGKIVQRDSAGRPTRMLGTHTDISLVKKMENALRESEEKYSKVFQNSPDTIILTSFADDKICEVNESIFRTFGYKRRDLLGNTTLQTKLWVEPAKQTEYIEHLRQDNNTRNFEAEFRTQSGLIKTCLISGEIINIRGQQYILSIVRDISDRKATYNMLQRSQFALNVSRDAILWIDPDTHIKYANEAASRSLGYSQETLLKMNVFDFAPNLPKTLWLKRNNKANSSNSHLLESIHRRKDGDTFPVEVAINFVEFEGTGFYIYSARDITNRRRAALILQKSEQRIRSFIQHTNEGIHMFELRHPIQITKSINQQDKAIRTSTLRECNDAQAQMFGFQKSSELIGKTCEDLKIYEDIDQKNRMLKKWIESGYTTQTSTRSVLSDENQLKWYKNTRTGIVEQGKLVRIWGTQSDITEQKLVEQELQASEEKIRSLVENINNIVYTIDTSGVITYINPTIETLLGYTPDEVIGHPICKYVHPSDHKSFNTYMLDSLSNKVPFQEFRFISSDGGIHTMFSTLCVLRKDNEVAGLTGTLTDMTAYHTMQQALIESETRYELLTEISPVGIFSTDRSGRIRYTNPRWCEITGQKCEDAIGTAWLQTIHPEDRHATSTSWEQTAREKLFFSAEFRFSHVNGSQRWVICQVAPEHDDTGEITSFIGTITDITERKQIEEQLRYSQKMEAVGHLAGGIAHDFNNLLTVINGYSEILLEDISPENHRYASVKQIHQAGVRAESLTRQLLAYSRKQILYPVVLDVNTLLKEMEKMLNRIIGEDIVLHTEYEKDLPAIKVDPSQIEQVILNLAVNSRDAMPQGGNLTIKTQNRSFSDPQICTRLGFTTGNYVMISMMDDGMGIDQNVLPNIFEPFYSTKPKGESSGLGLSTVYGIVKQSGGFIYADSKPEQGSTFSLYFPIHNTTDVSEETSGLSNQELAGNETILVVEDEDLVREFTIDVLNSYNYNVLHASGYDKAMEIIETCNTHIDILLTDVIMPNIGGKELARIIQSKFPDIKVIFMTGYTDSAIVHHGILDEDTVLIQKPFTIKSLLTRIREVLQ